MTAPCIDPAIEHELAHITRRYGRQEAALMHLLDGLEQYLLPALYADAAADLGQRIDEARAIIKGDEHAVR